MLLKQELDNLVKEDEELKEWGFKEEKERQIKGFAQASNRIGGTLFQKFSCSLKWELEGTVISPLTLQEKSDPPTPPAVL